jgi:hypothetical protein
MANPENKSKPRRQPNRVRSDTLVIRCRPEWREFVDQLVKHDHAGTAGELIERALAEYATRRSFPGKIPER